jgi:hypothetical protein
VYKSVDILALSSVQELHASPRLFVALFLLFSLYTKGVLYVFVLRYRNITLRANKKKVYDDKSNWTNKKSLKEKEKGRNNEWLTMLYTGESKRKRKGNQLLYT